ncbi:MAG: glycosyltransferase family 4 protein [Rhodospirillales bacterium]|nr:glycosyltransferase family 4 protein [Rhodospirillales bacterium]
MKTLILTLPPHIPGGVATKARILADHLKQSGHVVTIGFYAARGKYPDLNVSALSSLAGGAPRSQVMEAFGGHHCVAIGCKIPELEHRYTAPSPLWADLIHAHDRHIAVGGTVLMARPLVAAGVRHLVWCAADVEGDRRARRRSMGLLRSGFDRYFVSHQLKRQEKRVLSDDANRIMGVSPFSLASLAAVQARDSSTIAVLPIPTDMDFYSPASGSAGKLEMPVIGFAGRLDDPRKNPELLFQSVAALRAQGSPVALHVTGEPSPRLRALADKYAITDHVRFLGRLDAQALRDFYRSLALFVIASDQEGLAIVGIEALACGVPVISTRCGGPEAYLTDGENGYLCAFDAAMIAERAQTLLASADLYGEFSKNARASVLETYSRAAFEANLAEQWTGLWGEDLKCQPKR